MESPLESPADEVTRLRDALHQLRGIMARPGLWAEGEAPHAVATVLDVLLGIANEIEERAAGELEFANHQILHYTGRPLEELKQWGTNDTVHPEDLAHVAQVSSEAFASARPYQMVHRLRRSDGVYRWFQNNSFPLRETVSRWSEFRSDFPDRHLNLLRNASDAMVDVDDRPRHLLIRTDCQDGSRVHVSVRDAGVGIDAQAMNLEPRFGCRFLATPKAWPSRRRRAAGRYQGVIDATDDTGAFCARDRIRPPRQWDRTPVRMTLIDQRLASPHGLAVRNAAHILRMPFATCTGDSR